MHKPFLCKKGCKKQNQGACYPPNNLPYFIKQIINSTGLIRAVAYFLVSMRAFVWVDGYQLAHKKVQAFQQAWSRSVLDPDKDQFIAIMFAHGCRGVSIIIVGK